MGRRHDAMHVDKPQTTVQTTRTSLYCVRRERARRVELPRGRLPAATSLLAYTPYLVLYVLGMVSTRSPGGASVVTATLMTSKM